MDPSSALCVILPGLCPEINSRKLYIEDPSKTFQRVTKALFTNRVSFKFDKSDLCFLNLTFPSIRFIGGNWATIESVRYWTFVDSPTRCFHFQASNKTSLVERLQFQFFKSYSFIWYCWDSSENGQVQHDKALLVIAGEIQTSFLVCFEETTLHLQSIFNQKVIDSIVYTNKGTLAKCCKKETCNLKRKINRFHESFLIFFTAIFIIFCMWLHTYLSRLF